MASHESLLRLHQAASSISAIEYLPYKWDIVKQRFEKISDQRRLIWNVYYFSGILYIFSKVLTFLFELPMTHQGKLDVAKFFREIISIFSLIAFGFIYQTHGYFHHVEWADTINMLLNLNHRLKILSKGELKQDKASRYIHHLMDIWPVVLLGSLFSTFYNMSHNIIFDLFGGTFVVKYIFWAYEMQIMYTTVLFLRVHSTSTLLYLNCFANWLTALKKPLIRKRKKGGLQQRIPKYRHIYKSILFLHIQTVHYISSLAAALSFLICIVLVLSYFILVKFLATSSFSRLFMPLVMTVTTFTLPTIVSKTYVITKISAAILYQFKLNAVDPIDRIIFRSLTPLQTSVGPFFKVNRRTTLGLCQFILLYVMKFLLWFY